MKIQPTPELKARLFAQYSGIGIDMMCTAKSFQLENRALNGVILNDKKEQTLYLTRNGHSDFYSIDEWVMLLKPLSSITDGDAIEVIRVFNGNLTVICQFQTKINPFGEAFRQVYYEDTSMDDGFQGIDNISVIANFSNNGIHVLRSNRDTTYWKAIDFLRSKGYALPYMGISVEALIEWGWVKLVPDTI